LRQPTTRSRSIFDLSAKRIELNSLRRESEEQEFWNKPDLAQKVMKRISQLEDQINEWDEIAIEIDGLRSLLESG